MNSWNNILEAVIGKGVLISKWHPDVAQPQLSTATFFTPCVKLVYCLIDYRSHASTDTCG